MLCCVLQKFVNFLTAAKNFSSEKIIIFNEFFLVGLMQFPMPRSEEKPTPLGV